MGVPGSVPLGSIKGIPIRLHLLFIVLLVVQVAFSAINGPWWALFWFLLLGPILLFTVLVHELGHSLAARQVGGEAHGILLWPLGGLAYIGHNSGPKADIWVALAGPLTHIPMLIFWIIMMLIATQMAYGRAFVSLYTPYPRPSELGVALTAGAIGVNVGLLIFNLLIPAYPLDGGRIFADLLLTCGVAPVTAAKVTVGVAFPISVGIIIWGAVTLNVMLILVGIWIAYSTYQLFDTIRKGLVDQHPLFAFSSSSSGGGSNGIPELPMSGMGPGQQGGPYGPGQPGPYQVQPAGPYQPGPYQPGPYQPGAYHPGGFQPHPPTYQGQPAGGYPGYQVDPRFQL